MRKLWLARGEKWLDGDEGVRLVLGQENQTPGKQLKEQKIENEQWGRGCAQRRKKHQRQWEESLQPGAALVLLAQERSRSKMAALV